MRVFINGLNSLVTTSIVEYSNGDEVAAGLVYEKLERHCTLCMRLDHEEKECPEKERNPPGSPISKQALKPLVNQADNRRTERENEDRRRESRNGSSESTYSDMHHRERGYSRSCFRDLFGEQEVLGRSSRSQAPYMRLEELRSSSDRDATRREYEPKVSPGRAERAKYKEKSDLQAIHEEAETSRGSRIWTKSSENPATPPPPELREAINLAVDDIREVMVQYSNCPDPKESAARKERYRSSEKSGEVEETAMHMVQASFSSQSQNLQHQNQLVLRNPVNPEQASTSGVVRKIVPKDQAKRGPGRPLGKKRTQSSPRVLTGANSKKRKTVQQQNVARRRLVVEPVETPNPTVLVEGGTHTERPRERERSRRETSSKEGRRRMDFHIPSDPIP